MGFGYAVYFTERRCNRVVRWEPDTDDVAVVAGEPKDRDEGQSLRQPYGLAFDAGGHLLIADKFKCRICRLRNGKLEELVLRDVDGHRVRRPEIDSFYSAEPICPTGLFSEKNGAILCAFADDNTIYRIHPDGRLELVLGTPANRHYPPVDGSMEDISPAQVVNAPIKIPTGVVQRSDGTLFFIERQRQGIREYHPKRGLKSLFPISRSLEFLQSYEAPESGLIENYHPAHPGSLALDPGDGLYMTDSQHRCVLHLDTASGSFRRVISQTLQVSPNGGPAAIAFGPDGTAWVLNCPEGTVQGYRPRTTGEWLPTSEKLVTYRGRGLVLPESGSGIAIGA